ncbi:MAG: NCS2 family permease [Deltaproteobacteria bacterium]|nr:NCS2 family permease [Deltaproteobacteria bacterium]
MNTSIPRTLFVRKDIDGFFGLMTDNLMQLIVIGALCQSVCGMDASRVLGTILPGAAISIVMGNLFYAWQARRLARQEGRDDVTALPYGINTPSLFAFVFFIILPVRMETGSAELAWKVGLLACLGSGILELAGAFVAEYVRKHTPRVALLSALSGIAITFIAMDFALRIFSRPLIAFLPLAIILAEYFGRLRFPLGLPGGLVALGTGTLLAWGLQPFGFNYMDPGEVKNAFIHFQVHFPHASGYALWDVLRTDYAWKYISIIFPMGIINVIGSLQNIESAEAAGDRFPTMPSLAVNGIGSIAAALFGSCFPTTIYIGHPGWKALGARWGYSILNAIFIGFICVSGLVNLIFAVVPIEAGAAIVLWIGIVITAQAFQTTPTKHAPAAAFGLFPAVAAYAVMVMETALREAGKSWEAVGLDTFTAHGFHIYGMICLERGFIITSMILSATVASIIEKKFIRATIWTVIAALLSFIGIIHSFAINGRGIVTIIGIDAAPMFSLGYCIMGITFFAAHFLQKHGGRERR